MRRRNLLALLAAPMAARPFAAAAQQPAIPVIGYISSTSSAAETQRAAAFRDGLGALGLKEGGNVAIEYRYAEGVYDRLPALAADLVARNVSALFASALPAALAAQAATSTIPIVFRLGVDPVAFGLAKSLSRPGGNLTGVTMLFDPLTDKKLQLLHELVPDAIAVGFLINPKNRNAASHRERVEAGARVLGLKVVELGASTEDEIGAAFAEAHRQGIRALLIGDDPFLDAGNKALLELPIRYSIPTMYYTREFADSGGLISYGPIGADMSRQAGAYVGRVLKGEKPADLPVVQPTKFELVINLKTAKALGLTVSQSLLARVDEVIE
jgi:putative ABC transport system substrate-binding protein